MDTAQRGHLRCAVTVFHASRQHGSTVHQYFLQLWLLLLSNSCIWSSFINLYDVILSVTGSLCTQRLFNCSSPPRSFVKKYNISPCPGTASPSSLVAAGLKLDGVLITFTDTLSPCIKLIRQLYPLATESSSSLLQAQTANSAKTKETKKYKFFFIMVVFILF